MPGINGPPMHLLVIGLLLLVVACTFAIAGLLVVRKRVPLQELKANHEVGAIILAVVAQVYAVLMSFIVIVVWGQYTDTETLTMQEASSIGSMYWLAQGLPDTERREVQVSLRDYTQSVVIEEWPLMAQGVDLNDRADQAWTDHDDIWIEINQLSPDSPKETNVQMQLLEEMRTLDQDRRMRLLSAQRRMPNLMWVILLGGGVITVAFTYLFGAKHIWVQAGMTIGMVAIFGLILIMIAELDTPFSGKVQVQPTGFRSLLNLMNLYLGP